MMTVHVYKFSKGYYRYRAMWISDDGLTRGMAFSTLKELREYTKDWNATYNYTWKGVASNE